MSSYPLSQPSQPFQPSQPYAAPLPGQPGYQWGGAVPAYPFATFGQRLLAALIDAMVTIGIMAIPLILGVASIAGGITTTTATDGTTTGVVTNGGLFGFGIAMIGVGVVLALLYEPLLLARNGGHNGQTLGKQALGIRVTNLQGGPISAGQAWGRSLFAGFVSKNFFHLGYLWMLWDGMKQTWHDKVANTLVLDARLMPPQSGQ